MAYCDVECCDDIAVADLFTAVDSPGLRCKDCLHFDARQMGWF